MDSRMDVNGNPKRIDLQCVTFFLVYRFFKIYKSHPLICFKGTFLTKIYKKSIKRKVCFE